jgi:spore germination cell wall hydrolase CwlJ-like protein
MFAEAVVCLALNAYWEARNQDFAGMVAVNQVVMNRVISDDFPDTPCEVIYQGPHNRNGFPVRNRCQFSWYCDGKSDNIPAYDMDAWAAAQMAALGVYWGQVDNLVGDALWYHADYVYPDWASEKRKIVKIGDHIFYGWRR